MEQISQSAIPPHGDQLNRSEREAPLFSRKIFVIVCTPLGKGGRGGIDRLMDELRRHFPHPTSDGVSVRFITTRGASSIVWAPFHLLSAILLLIWYRVTARADVVHVNVASRGSALRKLCIGVVCKSFGIPYVLHLHGGQFHKFWNESSPMLARAIAGMFRNSADVVLLGSFWKSYVLGKLPSLSARIHVLPNGVPEPPSREARHRWDRTTILFAGRLGTHKGCPDLISALGRLADDDTWQAVLAGDGEIEQARSLAAELGIGGRVRIPGWLSGDAFDRVWDCADILVLPSRDENLPLSVVEAFARGIAVICTPVGALPDLVVDGQTGLFVEPGDVDGLTTAVLRLLKDRELRSSLGRNARAFFEQNLTISEWERRLEEIWRSAAGQST